LYTAFLWKTFFSGKTEGYLPSSRVKLMQGGRTFLQKAETVSGTTNRKTFAGRG
jgi:hypothetical protein